ncbi:MAG: penicillin-binding protein [Acidobacteriota bacterium]
MNDPRDTPAAHDDLQIRGDAHTSDVLRRSRLAHADRGRLGSVSAARDARGPHSRIIRRVRGLARRPEGAPPPARTRVRFAIALTVVAVWGVLIVARLVQLQWFEHAVYAERARVQQQRTVTLSAPRGDILDRHGQLLAVSADAASLAINPRLIDTPDDFVAALAPSLRAVASREWIRALPVRIAEARDDNRAFLWLVRQIEPQIADAVMDVVDARIEADYDARRAAAEAAGENKDAIKRAHHPMIRLAESKRYYPMGTLASHVLGYVDVDQRGLAGIEKTQESAIASRAGQRVVVRDAYARNVLHPRLRIEPPAPGHHLMLTIDATLQAIAERTLAEAVAEHGAKSGSLVALDPHTGAVRAMANVPTYDPNARGESDAKSWRNRAVADLFEPGSTFKMVTLAAALEVDAVHPEQRFDCGQGKIVLQGVRINDHKPFGVLSVREILAKSSNVGTIKIAQAVGREALYRTIRAFGFGAPTGIDLPGESPGLVRSLARWQPRSAAYISFGQEVGATTLQMATAFAAVANGGHLYQPYVVEALRAQDGTMASTERARLIGMPISPSTAQQLTQMLEGVVDDGTAKAAQVPGYRMVGKTGTAQKIVDGRYSERAYVAGFVGFGPLPEPELVVAINLDEPWPAYHGGEAAAPVFGAMMREAMPYLRRAPRPAPTPEVPALDPAIRRARVDPPRPTVRWSLPDAALPVDDGRTAALRADAVSPEIVPDFRGLSMRQAVRLASAGGWAIAPVGSGFVVDQDPAPATRRDALDDDAAVVRVRLAFTAPDARSAAADRPEAR